MDPVQASWKIAESGDQQVSLADQGLPVDDYVLDGEDAIACHALVEELILPELLEGEFIEGLDRVDKGRQVHKHRRVQRGDALGAQLEVDALEIIARNKRILPGFSPGDVLWKREVGKLGFGPNPQAD